MDNKISEIFIPGPAVRLEAKYYKSKKNTSPIAIVLQPHPQYGGTMNNKVVVETFNAFMENDFSVCRFNFRGVGKSDGQFDNGQGELADAAASLDWLERENFDNSQCWVTGFSFGSLIAMQLGNAVSKGYSPSLPSCRILGEVAIQEALLGSYSWYACVPTASTVADPASRLSFDLASEVLPGVS